MKKSVLFIALLLFICHLSAQIPVGYYNTTTGLSGMALKTALYNIIKGHTQYPYTDVTTDTWDILKLSDHDTVNSANVIMLYSGLSIDAAQEWNSGAGWTREHVWSKSHGFPPLSGDPDPGAGTDCHHLRPEKPAVNSAKGNKDFDMGGTPVSSAPECNSTSDTWEPRDAVKGDVARMIFYMATRYLGENGEPNLQVVDYTPSIDPPLTGSQPLYGKLSTLLLWNLQDPPDNFERHRNEVVFGFQHNRNPFIDHPEWVNCIWGNCNQVTFTTLPVTTVNSGLLYNYNIQFVGLAGSTLNLTSSSMPGWLTLNQTTNTTAVLSGTPINTDIGPNVVSLVLTDNFGSVVYQNFTIDVTQPGAGTTIIGQDFTICSPTNWTTYSVAGTKNWTCTAGYEEINAYGSDVACEDWLISPQTNFYDFTSEALTFTSRVKYTDVITPQLTVKYSSDYVVGQDPNNYAWSDLSSTLATTDVWTQSGTIDLSAKEDASAFIAFKYISSGTGSGTAAYWKVDDILLTGTPKNTGISNNEIKYINLELFPNPFVNAINVSYNLTKNSSSNIEIFNISGQKLKSLSFESQNFGNHNLKIDLSNLPLGVYFVKMNIAGNLINKKIVKL